MRLLEHWGLYSSVLLWSLHVCLLSYFSTLPPIAPPLTKSTYCCFWFCHVLPSRVRKTRGNTDFIVLGTKRAISDQSFFLKFILVIIFTKFHFFAATQQLHINFTLKNPLLPFLILNSYCLMFRFVLHWRVDSSTYMFNVKCEKAPFCWNLLVS